MTAYGFLRPDNAPTEEGAQALPQDIPHMSKENGEKQIVWFHDESAYNTTEDTPTLGGRKTAYLAEGEGFVDHVV